MFPDSFMSFDPIGTIISSGFVSAGRGVQCTVALYRFADW
jgi:20S proteasome alpha/beta subunit